MELGVWVSYQRSAFKRDELSKKPKLSKEKSDLLEKTFDDWSWDSKEDLWKNKFEALKEYYEEFGTSLIPRTEKYKGLFLGNWVAEQRKKFRRDE